MSRVPDLRPLTYNAWMLALRYAYLLALVVWLGGMIVAGMVVAPSAFGTLQAWDAVEGRVLAGQVFGEVLRRLHVVGYVAGGLMLVVLTVERLLGPKPVSFGIRAGLLLTMLACTLYSGVMVAPAVHALQQQVSGPMNLLPSDDARRVAFDRLHGRSSMVLSATAVCGLLLLLWEARER